MFWLPYGSTKTIKIYEKTFIINFRMEDGWLSNDDIGLVQLGQLIYMKKIFILNFRMEYGWL